MLNSPPNLQTKTRNISYRLDIGLLQTLRFGSPTCPACPVDLALDLQVHDGVSEETMASLLDISCTDC